MLHAPARPMALLPLLILAALAATPRPAAADTGTPPAPHQGTKPGPEPASRPESLSTPAPADPAADALAAEQARHVADCKAHALARLKARSAAIDDIFIDMDGLTIAKADLKTPELKIGGARIDTVIMGEAYIQRDHSDKVHRFLCLTGESGSVLMTFFTEQ